MKAVVLAITALLVSSAAVWAAEAGPGGPTSDLPGVPAQLTAVRHTTLSAELAATIERVAVREGETFHGGDTLVTFDCTVERARLAEARALLDAAERTDTVHRRLLALNSVGTLEAQKAASDAVVAKARVDLARAVVSKCAIRAPYDGVVTARTVQDHQYVQQGQALLEILNSADLEAEFIVPSAWVTSLGIGQTVSMRIDETGTEHPARIVRIGGKVDAVSHSVKVMADIEGDHPELMAGMTGTVTLSPP